MKKILHIVILSLAIIGTFNVSFVSAATPAPTGGAGATIQDYEFLAPLSDGTGAQIQKGTLATYVRSMYYFIIGFAAVLAVLMIVVGGLQTMSTDSIFQHQEGIKRIKNAVYGLLLIISSWLILYSINPQFVDLSPVLGNAPVTSTPPSPTDTSNPDDYCKVMGTGGVFANETKSCGGGAGHCQGGACYQ